MSPVPPVPMLETSVSVAIPAFLQAEMRAEWVRLSAMIFCIFLKVSIVMIFSPFFFLNSVKKAPAPKARPRNETGLGVRVYAPDKLQVRRRAAERHLPSIPFPSIQGGVRAEFL